MIDQALQAKLEPIRRRLLLRELLEKSAASLAVGAGIACLLGGSRLVFAGWIPLAAAAAALAIPPLATVAMIATRKTDWPRAARLADERYNLRDRTLTAVALSEQQDGSAAAALQLADALAALEALNPSDPPTEPRAPIPWKQAVGLSLLALLISVAPIPDFSPPQLEEEEEPPRIVRGLGRAAPDPETSAKLAIRSLGTAPDGEIRPAPKGLGKRVRIQRFFRGTRSGGKQGGATPIP
ncbi:MAG: hypothetical protein N2C14_20965 [Planctomycetales bacterium]